MFIDFHNPRWGPERTLHTKKWRVKNRGSGLEPQGARGELYGYFGREIIIQARLRCAFFT